MSQPLTADELLKRVEATWRNYEIANAHDLSPGVLKRLLATHITAMEAYLAAQTQESTAPLPAPPSPVRQASLFGDNR